METRKKSERLEIKEEENGTADNTLRRMRLKMSPIRSEMPTVKRALRYLARIK